MRTYQMATLGIVLLVPATTAAQVQAAPLGPGARVRVWAPQHGWAKRQARLSEVASDTLVLAADSVEIRRGRAVRVEFLTRIPVTDVARLEVMSGQHPNVIGGLKNGVLIGGAIGLVLGVAAYASSDADQWISYGPEIIPAAVLACGFWGSILGLGIGALDKTEDWQQVWLSSRPSVGAAPRFQIMPRPTGIGIGATFTF